MENSDIGVVLPLSIVRKAAPPRLALVWASGDVDPLLAALEAAGLIAVQLAPTDTYDFLAVYGPPSVVLLDADLLEDHEVLDSIRAICERSTEVRIGLLGSPDSRPLRLLKQRASA